MSPAGEFLVAFVIIVVVVVGVAVMLVDVGAVVVVVPLKVEVVLKTPVLVGLDVMLVGADPDWTSSPPQPARTMKTTDVTLRTAWPVSFRWL